jgi:type II secretory pathway pseudopilin PulG
VSQDQEHRRFTLIEWLVILIIVAIAAAVFIPIILSQTK